MSERTAAAAWMKSRSRVWSEWLTQLPARPHDLDVASAQRFIERYRALARDLASARRLLPGSRATAALETLYVAAHADIDRSARTTAASLLHLLRDEIPAIVRSLRPTILWLALLLCVATAAGYWLIDRYPDLVVLVASDKMIDDVEHGRLWTEGLLHVTPASLVSMRILSNNIVVSLFAFCAGIFFGLGAFYIVAINGLMLGAMFAFTHHYGIDGQLLKFVLAHGPVELSVMCIAGAAGTALGESLIRPSAPTRRESFQLAANRIVRVLLACALLLIGCGLIEGFISPDPRPSLALRAAIGLGYWLLMLAFLSGRLLRPFGARSA
ncbi:MAG TPA: stage II sporulation protein M [Steroidobacteraceae bacterium]|jgi:uncharacterized membrane protein SpoIIM required for sporulation